MKQREIKFRAWDKKDKMMYADIQKGIKFTDLSHYTFDEFLGNKKGMGDYHEWVVMQYTGLKDKDGVEIYEGDIINIFGEVFFHKGCWVVGEGNLDENALCNHEGCKIIGNICKNPELLK